MNASSRPTATLTLGAARHRGTVYLIALSTAMIVTVMGVSGLLAVRVQHRSAQLDADLLSARAHARSAAELAMHHLANNPNWPQLTEGERTVERFGDDGRGSFDFRYRPADDQASLDESACDGIWIEAAGRHGDTRALLEVLVEPRPRGSVSHRDALLRLVPLAYWPLNDAAGPAIDRVGEREGAYDEVTRSLHDSTLCTTVAGYDGSNSTVEVPHDDALMPDSGSVVLWFRTEDIDREQGLFSKDARDHGNGGHFTVRIANGSLTAVIGSATQDYQATTGRLEEFRWYHLVVTFGAGGLNVYIDGEHAASNGYAGGFAGNREPIAIGADLGESGSNSFDGVRDPLRGQMFDVALFNYPLSAEQVGQLYREGNLHRDYHVASMGWRDRVE